MTEQQRFSADYYTRLEKMEAEAERDWASGE